MDINAHIVTEIDNFLSKDECLYLISLIDKHNKRSTVFSSEYRAESELRTSSTCIFDINDDTVKKIHEKISIYLNIPIQHSEPLQGQLYNSGQYFRPHHDYFHAGTSYDYNCLSSGNRTHTFLIYLNEDMQGGETNFPFLSRKIKPKMGKAIVWNNCINGKVIPESIHEGCEVKSGNKYIITSWWRENVFNPKQDKILRDKIVSSNGVKYSSRQELPKCNSNSFSINVRFYEDRKY